MCPGRADARDAASRGRPRLPSGLLRTNRRARSVRAAGPFAPTAISLCGSAGSARCRCHRSADALADVPGRPGAGRLGPGTATTRLAATMAQSQRHCWQAMQTPHRYSALCRLSMRCQLPCLASLLGARGDIAYTTFYARRDFVATSSRRMSPPGAWHGRSASQLSQRVSRRSSHGDRHLLP